MSADVRTLASATPANEIIAEKIAGPETAARLGVPVGSVVYATHITQPLDGSPATERELDPSAVEAMRSRGELMSPEKE